MEEPLDWDASLINDRKLFAVVPVADFNCGLRGHSKEAFLKMDLRTTGMELASEMIVKATLQEMKTAEVPTTLSRDGRTRAPHLRSWRETVLSKPNFRLSG